MVEVYTKKSLFENKIGIATSLSFGVPSSSIVERVTKRGVLPTTALGGNREDRLILTCIPPQSRSEEEKGGDTACRVVAKRQLLLLPLVGILRCKSSRGKRRR